MMTRGGATRPGRQQQRFRPAAGVGPGQEKGRGDAVVGAVEAVVPGHDPEVVERHSEAAPGTAGWIVRLD